MTLLVDIVLWTAVVLLAIAVAMRGRPFFDDALRHGIKDFLALLPRVAIGVIGSGYLAELLPQSLIAAWLGPDSGVTGLVLASVAGALTPGGPVVGFAIGATALKSGAGAPQVIAYSVAWALFAIPRLFIFEVPSMPARVVLVRAAVSLPLPLLAALGAILLGKP